MCGIFGAIGDATDAANQAAVRALAHRGPDSSATYLDGDAGLAHTRLRIIDLTDAGAQPMPGCDPRVRVTFNGEIYNHHELRRTLEAAGHVFRSRSDTEAIVHGYEEWGEGVVERLDGMFAFGLWDGPRRRLLLARDRTGKKPLFYTLSDGDRALRFASEVKALIAAGHSEAIEPRALPMLLSFGYVPAPQTIHRGVLQLPPASMLLFEPGGGSPRIRSYWRPTFLDAPIDVDEHEARARVRELVIRAVERRLEADVPLGAFLSGGLDSSIVVSVMARLLGRRVKTFSIGFAGDDAYDETPYSRRIARLCDTEHTEFIARPSLDTLEHLVWLHDGPFADASAIPTHIVSRLTREHVTVALSGDGGDELFAGYQRFLAAEAAERVPHFVTAGLSRLERLVPGHLHEQSLVERGRRFLAGASLPLPDRVARWAELFAHELPTVLRRDVAGSMDIEAPSAWQHRFFDEPGSASPLARLLQHNLLTYLPYDIHPKVDRCSSGVALEVRSPFLDTALVEYVGRLPDRFKRKGLRTKAILRDAFADLIPAEILHRGKMGFSIPLSAWFRGDLRGRLEEVLGPPSASLYQWIDHSQVQRLLAQHDAGRTDAGRKLWLLLTLELWLRSLARGATAEPETVTTPLAS